MRRKRIHTMFGTAAVPFGRRKEVLAAIQDHETLAWEKAGRNLDPFAGDYLVRFASRRELIATAGNGSRFRPVVPWTAAIDGNQDPDIIAAEAAQQERNRP